ncbi:phenylalanine 4-monooxygenase, partial [Vibrio sp. Vb1980]|nr:phenylalanine 4-monooxygenase [Vibrio sp. Vb1980]
RDELDYLQEPDIFHEIFGHCAMLTNPAFAHFTHLYGQLGQKASKEERVFLARLYWFTVEFGLIESPAGLRIYGGGILSSIGETAYALSGQPLLQPFDLLEVLRTPYRIDIMQPKYYVIDDFSQLFQISQLNLLKQADLAIDAGLLPPLFEPKEPAHAE